jgi:hypothetical protein
MGCHHKRKGRVKALDLTKIYRKERAQDLCIRAYNITGSFVVARLEIAKFGQRGKGKVG